MAKFLACAEHFATNNGIAWNEAVSTLLVYMYVWLTSVFPQLTAHCGHCSCIALSFCWSAVGWGIRDRKFRGGVDLKNRQNPFNQEVYLSQTGEKKAMEWLGDPGAASYTKDLKLLNHLFAMFADQGYGGGVLHPCQEATEPLPLPDPGDHKADGAPHMSYSCPN